MMIRFQCESCRRLKENGESWILGFVAENIGVVLARCEISIADAWDRSRAVQAFAVHFCSDKCRNKYVNELFSDVPETQKGEKTAIKRWVKRIMPGEVVDTVVAERTRPKIVRRTTVRRKAV